MQQKGYIKLYRQIQENWIWKRPDYFQAWCWLLMRARFEEGEKTDMVDGKLVTWGRGELVDSLRFMQKAWRWKSDSKVRLFLKKLSDDGMIIVEKRKNLTHVTICNYESYNNLERRHNADTTQTQRRHNADTTQTQRKDKNGKNGKNVNNDKKEGENKNFPPPTDELSQKIGSRQAMNLRAANFEKLEPMKQLALKKWAQHLHEAKFPALTQFQFETIVNEFKKHPGPRLADFIAKMISENQRGLYFDRLEKNKSNGRRKQSAKVSDFSEYH